MRSSHSVRQETEILWRVHVYGRCTSLSDADLVWQWGAQSHQQNQNNSGVQPLCREQVEHTFPVQVGLAMRRSTELCDVHGVVNKINHMICGHAYHGYWTAETRYHVTKSAWISKPS